jgi:hypothetical protein
MLEGIKQYLQEEYESKFGPTDLRLERIYLQDEDYRRLYGVEQSNAVKPKPVLSFIAKLGWICIILYAIVINMSPEMFPGGYASDTHINICQKILSDVLGFTGVVGFFCTLPAFIFHICSKNSCLRINNLEQNKVTFYKGIVHCKYTTSSGNRHHYGNKYYHVGFRFPDGRAADIRTSGFYYEQVVPMKTCCVFADIQRQGSLELIGECDSYGFIKFYNKPSDV